MCFDVSFIVESRSLNPWTLTDIIFLFDMIYYDALSKFDVSQYGPTSCNLDI